MTAKKTLEGKLFGDTPIAVPSTMRTPSRYRIMGNLIIKGEEQNIRDVITNIAPYIDALTILDTGSSPSDRGMMIARDTMNELSIPGRIRQMVMPSGIYFDFGIARTAALRLAEETLTEMTKSPAGPLFPNEWDYYQQCINNWYIFVIDADNRIAHDGGKFIDRKNLGKDHYLCTFQRGVKYKGNCLTRVDLDGFRKWCWKGKRHEYTAPLGSFAFSEGSLTDGLIISGQSGIRARDPFTYNNDLLIFEQEMRDDPFDERACFYAAQSARDCRRHTLAVEYYLKRADMKGWGEEVYCSLLEAAKWSTFLAKTDKEKEDVMSLYYRAMDIMPNRLEAPYHVIQFHNGKKQYIIGYALALAYQDKPFPHDDKLFVDEGIHRWGFYIEASVACSYAGNKALFKKYSDLVVNNPSLEAPIRDRAASNLKLILGV